jgi:hypothetical protein
MAVTRSDLRSLALAAARVTADPARRRGLRLQAYAMTLGPSRPFGERTEREDPRIRRDRLRSQCAGQPRDERGRWAAA